MSNARKFWSYQCEWDGCDKSFKSISAFEAHYRRHTDQHLHACDYGSCTETFHHHGALSRHRSTHANERPFVCKYESCGQAYHDSEALELHCHTHQDELPLACKYDSCGQAFDDRGKLIEHHRTHKQRPLACEYQSCSRTFARRETLEAHMHMHTKEQPFACTYEGCNKSFCDRGGLTQHENIHKSKSLHMCGYKSCNQTFTKLFQLHRHFRKEHEKSTESVEVRPIRLRLSQPKRQSPESFKDSPRKRLRIQLPMEKTLGDTSTTDPTESHERGSKPNSFAKQPSNRTERSNVHHDTRPYDSSTRVGFISEASGKCNVSTHGANVIPTAAPLILTPNVRPQAPTSQPTIKSKPAEHKVYEPQTDEQSSGHGVSGYTRVCGVYSMEKASPKKPNTNGGPYHCPRCDTQFTRAHSVMRHFVGCITRYGNPDSLKWTDHLSLQGSVKFYARNGHPGQEDGFLPQVVLSSPKHKPSGKANFPQKDIIQPLHKRRDALRRSKYNPETIARDVLLAMGSHPNLEPLNAHLDILRKRFKVVNLESNMSTFRWDVVDPELDPEPERQPQHEVEPGRSARKPPEAEVNKNISKFNYIQWYNDAPSSLQSRFSTKPDTLGNEVPVTVFLPQKTHFGSMSTIFSSVFDRDPCARLMSSNADLWAAVFTMLERCYHRQTFVIRAAVGKSTGDVVGWVACHEVDTLPATPVDSSADLDWTTAARLLPSPLSRFTTTKESAEEKAKRSNQRKVGQGLASTIQAQATAAQIHLVPIHRLVINALVVHPLHQGRGVASALLKSVIEIADIRKIPTWVQAPEDPTLTQGVPKAGLFQRAGFMCAGELNLDLDSCASGCRQADEEKGATLGKSKWNYMLRWPQPIMPKPTQWW